MRQIFANGTPSEFGKAYGTQAAELVRYTVKAYRKLLRETLLTPKRLQELVDTYHGNLAQHAPECIDTLAGIADASGVSVSDLVLLNARSELIALSGAWSPMECTSIALLGIRTDDGQPRVAQNWDWLSNMEGFQVILHGKPEGAPAYVSFCEAGHLAKISMNEHGLAVGLNFLLPDPAEYPTMLKGLPVHFLLYRVLRAKTVAEAVQILKDTPRGGGANFTLADATGQVACVEISPESVEVIYPDGFGVVTHANDYEAGKTKAVRSRRLLHLSDKRMGHTRDDLFILLQDHAGTEPICCHPATGGASMSIVSVVLEPCSRTLWVAEGLPCKHNVAEGYNP